MRTLFVFSHLRWNFVFQRPQHLMTRLAKHYRIYFVEEPEFEAGYGSRLELSEVAPNVTVVRPQTYVSARGFHDDQLPELRRLLHKLITDQAIDDYAVWLYTPMALPLLQRLQPRAIVYDCMDELANFKSAPRQLLQRESALLKVANVVFTGGPSLYRAKRDRHENVHCFPSSVDGAHFAQARTLEPHPVLQAMPRPRLGFYGVIDERIDLDLIAAVAAARPDWQLVLAGPVAKISHEDLPRAPNIHYLGQQPYADLPRLLAGWELCLLPFALNEATRYISPTKTLEYIAAERTIVGTPITDVAEPYGDLVYIADGAEQFIAACERGLGETAADRVRRLERASKALAGTSWDSTAEQMHALVESACGEGLKPEAHAILEHTLAAAADTLSLPRLVRATRSYDAAVMGAGPTGLSAAYHLGARSVLLEQNERVGGWCRSVYDKGFTFDYAGHIMFSNDPYVLELYGKLLGDNVHWQNREAWVYSKGVHTRYPFQGALYGLPPKVIKECIVGAIEARFGSLTSTSSPAPATAGQTPTACKSEDAIADCCADGILESSAGLAQRSGGGAAAAPRNFEEFIYQVWGAGIAKHFAVPYNRKLWAVPLSQMETSWLGGRVPLPDLEEMIEGALEPVAKPMGPNARFGYPLRGGFQALMDGFLPHLKGDLRLNTRIVGVSPARHALTLSDGTTLGYDHLISTLPLPALIRMIGSAAPEDVRRAADGLRHVSVRCVNLGIGRESLTDKHWIYYPEQTVFHRIFVQGNASPYCNPPGGFGLTCEITYSEDKPLPCDGEALIRRCIDDCIEVGMFERGNAVLAANQVDMPYAYVIYDHGRAHNVDTIKQWLAQHDIVLAGRYSEWEYYNSDHAFVAGKRAAEAVMGATSGTRAATARSA